MASARIHDAIRKAIEGRNFLLIVDRFAEDVELGITVVSSSTISHQYRGKRLVIGYLPTFVSPRLPFDKRWDYFQSGDRIVAFRDGRLDVEIGLTVRCEVALVFDVHDGLISRVTITYELSAELDSQRRRSSLARQPRLRSGEQRVAVNTFSSALASANETFG